MKVLKYSEDTVEVSEGEGMDPKLKRNRDARIFLKGVILGFGLAAAASTLFNLFNEQREMRKTSGLSGSTYPSYESKGGMLGDLSYAVDESTSAFRDAVRTLDKTFESGIKAIDSVKDVIDKIREE